MSDDEFREAAQRIDFLLLIGRVGEVTTGDWVTVFRANYKRDDGEPVTAEWLESVGFLQDGDLKSNAEYGKRVWSVSSVGDDDEDNMLQVLISAKDHSFWLEAYDACGDSLALIELPGKTRGDVRRLCRALGVDLTE